MHAADRVRNVSLFSGLAPAEIDGILGPGRLCGHMGLIDGVAHSTTMVARENTTLLEITKPAFDRRYHGCERINAKFRDAINRNLLEALAHTNNHLTRLIRRTRSVSSAAARTSTPPWRKPEPA